MNPERDMAGGTWRWYRRWWYQVACDVLKRPDRLNGFGQGVRTGQGGTQRPVKGQFLRNRMAGVPSLHPESTRNF